MNTDANVTDSSPWRECVPGELTEFATQHLHRQQRRVFLRNVTIAAAGCAAAGCAAVGVAGVLWRPKREQRFAPGGLVCDEVTRLLPAYIANQLDAKRKEQVRTHLASCSHCTERLKKLQHASSSKPSQLRFRQA